ncbi:MAG TPA: zinc-dependent alcohol dehydrogenase family protein [Thermoanaerobaculia bacterium]|nr:zinc-dependent alcohol dehydrogenase family protein [Thermoanaerobaculia bacterium]
MRAMVLERAGQPLRETEMPRPEPGPGQVLLRVHACGVCRTDLHIVDGELTEPKLPLVLGHQIVGTVEAAGAGVDRLRVGERAGVPWLGWTDGTCRYCRSGRENLCERALFTGYQIDGGYAEYAVADQRFCLPLPAAYPDLQAAPLLCAGLIGYRAYRMALGLAGGQASSGHPGEQTGAGPPGERAVEVERLGFYGFGAAAHILVQVARHQGRQVFAFTRPGDAAGQRFALDLGAVWSGGAGETPPEPLDAAILFAPAGEHVPAALRAVAPGGAVVCAGIHMSDIPSFPYEILWRERAVRSVANLTRRDGEEFLALAPTIPVRTAITPFPLARANEALAALREGRFHGAAVVVVD